MTKDNADILIKDSVLEDLAHTLLYEGYALYPYHRTAIKNQKPIPFGVVYPQQYNDYNVHAHSIMQTECILIGSSVSQVNISVRFLQLKKITLLAPDPDSDIFIPVNNLDVNGRSYQAGWQTIEQQINTGDVPIKQLINSTNIDIDSDEIDDSKMIYDESGKVAGKMISTIAAVKGSVNIKAEPVENMQNAFRITVVITNSTLVENPESISRDEVLLQSFLSTHTILQTLDGKFISHQNPGEKWKETIATCTNKNTWPILINETDRVMLSSPIILYDYPKINPKSHVDLYDSTEIEEALLLHVNLLSDEEKGTIGESDEKLQAMLNKVREITPEELMNIHSGLEDNATNELINLKNE